MDDHWMGLAPRLKDMYAGGRGPERKAVNATIFYRGLLFALREKAPKASAEFIAKGDRFHEAFGNVLAEAKKAGLKLATEMLDNFDPVFGVYPHANEMLLQAERDFILSMLNPQLQRAQFKISATQARRELLQLPPRQVELFRSLAKTMTEQLAAKKSGRSKGGRPNPAAPW